MRGDLLSFIVNTVRKFNLVHLHWLSFDLAAVAIISQIAFSKIPIGKAQVNIRATIVLGLGVFIISSLNKLLDHRKPAKAEAKKFLNNQKEHVSFLKIITGVLILAIILVFLLPEALCRLMLGLAFFSGLCIFIGSRLPEKSPLHCLREPISALILTVSILGNMFLLKDNPSWENKYSVVLFFMIVFQNILLSSYFQAITFPGTSNLATLLKAPLAKRILHGITFLVIAGCITVCLQTEFRYTQRLSVILMGMSVLQSCVLQKTNFSDSNKYKGMLITLILILPFLIL